MEEGAKFLHTAPSESGLAWLGDKVIPTSRVTHASLPPPSSVVPRFLSLCESPPDKMSYIARRGLSTLIPPKIASPNAIGAAQDAARMERVVNFYAGLPRGPAPQVKATGLIGRYKARYFDQNSGVPIVHAIAGILILGYSMEYYFHLREFRLYRWVVYNFDQPVLTEKYSRPPQEPPPLN
ncbi:unnamed protein product [Penicillium pancosmium]